MNEQVDLTLVSGVMTQAIKAGALFGHELSLDVAHLDDHMPLGKQLTQYASCAKCGVNFWVTFYREDHEFPTIVHMEMLLKWCGYAHR